jgi:Fe-S-cluster containining protein
LFEKERVMAVSSRTLNQTHFGISAVLAFLANSLWRARTMSDERSEFTHNRTECACKECVRNCYFIPGYLVPSDIHQIAEHLKETELVRFAFDNLLASPGATIIANGQILQIPTLVPARRPDSACRFLKDDRCTIHSVSPYACRLFDHSQTKEQADAISMQGLREVAKAWRNGDLYALLWLMLRAAGEIAPAPLEARARMQASLERREIEDGQPSARPTAQP